MAQLLTRDQELLRLKIGEMSPAMQEDFQKENLRKDYVKVCGIKWAKGNLVYDKGNLYNVVQAGVDDNFQTGWGLHDDQYKFIKYDTGVANYENNADWFTGMFDAASVLDAARTPTPTEDEQ